jgi:hypothetical protein
MFDIMDKAAKIAKLGSSTRDKQKVISVSEVMYVFDILVAKYDAVEEGYILRDFTEDTDLVLLISKALEFFEYVVKQMEDTLAEYGISSPDRPPIPASTALNVEIFRDKYIFQVLFQSVQTLCGLVSRAFNHSPSPDIRKMFKEIMYRQLDINDLFYEYGKLKNLINEVPIYRP